MTTVHDTFTGSPGALRWPTLFSPFALRGRTVRNRITSTPHSTGWGHDGLLTQAEVDRLLHRVEAVRPASRAQFSIGESVKVISGPLSDFSGEISEINEDASKLKVLVSIFGRETPVEVGYDQVKKI